ncbi:TonB-dependent receptor [Agarilytica rhodophyticola]|uniref:TonB-dependent receptor n=1 Tax=Agarilytica rhodophyticola TaxID=1737490 RepID=UPI000B349D46|nr:TonB-dependent receptor [Agarilytica rhodophyticola]
MGYKHPLVLPALSISTLALALNTYAQNKVTENVNEGLIQEEVIVTGIRQSLEAAADAKRADARIIDTIVAEDIGKLPDNNIAEALQRITGVSINREFGVGSEVSIRGLPQNRVELNGRSTLGDGRNGVDFQDFPSDFLSGVEVVKSPTPKMIEGALGGTINLKTVRPLDTKDRVLSISTKGEYTDNTEHWGPILNTTYGDQWSLDSSGNFGVIASISYQERELRRDESRVGFDVEPLDLDGDGELDPGNIVIPINITYLPAIDTRERLAGNVSLQWQPTSSQGMLYFEGAFTQREGDNQTFSPLSIIHSPLRARENLDNLSDAEQQAIAQRERDAGFRIDDTGQIVDYTDTDVRFLNRTESTFRNTDSISAAFGGEWSLSGNIQISGELSYADSETFEPSSDFRFYAVDPVREAANPAAFNPLNGGIRYDTDNNSVPTVALTDPNTFLDPNQWVFRRYENREDFVDNDETAARFDITFDTPFTGVDFISSIDAGVRFSDRGFQASRNRLFVSGLENQLQNANGDPIVIPMTAFPDGTISQYNFDAFDGDSARYDLANFLTFNADVLQNEERTLQIVADLLRGTNREISGNRSDLAFQFDRFATVDEETTAAYIQFNIDAEVLGLPVRGVAGTRYVRTELETGAFERNTSGDFVPTSDSNNYDDWLPSMNLTMNVQDDTLLRFAAAKVMRRPDFNQLNPAFNINVDNTRAERGNPQLNPFRATQYDLSIEHYWGESNLISVAIFYKDVSSFLSQTQICSNAPSFVAISNPNVRDELCFLDGRGDNPALTSPLLELGIPTTIQTNGESGTVEGFELGYQQSFDFLPAAWSGLGISANYTYADSEDPNGTPLEDISENTYNASIYYEKYGFSTRLAYTYRDRFLDSAFENRVREVGVLLLGPGSDDPTLGNSFREPIEQLDWSASYDINAKLRIQADIVNLTKEPTLDTATNGALYQVRQSDRRFTLGVRVKL